MAWQKQPKNDLGEDADKIYTVALIYLGKREYCTQQLRLKLLMRGAAAEQTETVLTRLRDKGYLDDTRYAIAYVKDRRQFRPCGASLMKGELRTNGIDEVIIDTVLAEEYDTEREKEALCLLLRKAAAEAPETSDLAGKKRYREKIIRRLLAKGFSQGAILGQMAFFEETGQADGKLSIDRRFQK